MKTNDDNDNDIDNDSSRSNITAYCLQVEKSARAL